jgi:hypothetical protein
MLKSIQLKAFISSFYRFTPFYPGRLNGPRTVGKLVYRRINKLNRNESMAFLAGVFFVHGDIDIDGYKIRLGNSFSKIGVINKLLVKMGCEIMEYRIYKNIPEVHVIIFDPTPELKIIFDNEFIIRKELECRNHHQLLDSFNLIINANDTDTSKKQKH